MTAAAARAPTLQRLLPGGALKVLASGEKKDSEEDRMELPQDGKRSVLMTGPSEFTAQWRSWMRSNPEPDTGHLLKGQPDASANVDEAGE